MIQDKFEQLKKKLQKLAVKDTLFDDEESTIMDACGGNFDDAYELGCKDGEIAFARELLYELFPEEIEVSQ